MGQGSGCVRGVHILVGASDVLVEVLAHGGKTAAICTADSEPVDLRGDSETHEGVMTRRHTLPSLRRSKRVNATTYTICQRANGALAKLCTDSYLSSRSMVLQNTINGTLTFLSDLDAPATVYPVVYSPYKNMVRDNPKWKSAIDVRHHLER